jgi:hypothetical protein
MSSPVEQDLTFAPPPPGVATLIVDPSVKQVITTTVETDVRTAMARCVKELLQQATFRLPGREVRFKEVREVWAEPEDDAQYPSACVFTEEDGKFDLEDSRILPGGGPYANNAIEGVPGAYWYSPCEFVQTLILEVFTTSPREREALSAMLMALFFPVTWKIGFRMKAPFYHGAHIDFLPETSGFVDNEEDARRRFRKIRYSIVARAPMLRVMRGVPTAETGGRIIIDLSGGTIHLDGGITVAPCEYNSGTAGPDGDPLMIPVIRG